jgi:hypothetical protein
LVERREFGLGAVGTVELLLSFLGPLLRTGGVALSLGVADVEGEAGAGAGALVDDRSGTTKVRKRSFRASNVGGGAVGGAVVGGLADEADATESVLDEGRTDLGGDIPTETNLNRAERFGGLKLEDWTGDGEGKAMLDGVREGVAGGRAAFDDPSSNSAAA